MDVCHEDAEKSNLATADKGKATIEKLDDETTPSQEATFHHAWSFGKVADFINKLAMQLTLADVDSVLYGSYPAARSKQWKLRRRWNIRCERLPPSCLRDQSKGQKEAPRGCCRQTREYLPAD